MSNLQRSSSAPLTVAGLAKEQQALSRTKSHLHVEKPQPKPYLKPLTRAVVVPSLASSSSSSSGEREDPFNLAGFFPPEKESWGWLRAEEPEQIVEEADDAEDSDEEPSEEVAVSTAVQETWHEEDEPLSPYRLEATEWDAVYAKAIGRRRRYFSGGEAGGPGLAEG